MSDVAIVYKCGHLGKVTIWCCICDEHFRQAKYEAKKLCPDCYKKQVLEPREAENSASAEAAKTAGLPALQGTEKQITWATTIRHKKLSELPDEYEQLLSGRTPLGPLTPEEIALVDTDAARVRALTSSPAWIEARNSTPLFAAQAQIRTRREKALRGEPVEAQPKKKSTDDDPRNLPWWIRAKTQATAKNTAKKNPSQ